ncbi:hypothetical protein, partial [Mesorhizobium sp. B2-6-7]|uniref:hypothetical protein n=1 Tax=Mesorhizobium sp. B2-6-7 TaxID=2589910 RepID=UPI001AED21ED
WKGKLSFLHAHIRCSYQRMFLTCNFAQWEKASPAWPVPLFPVSAAMALGAELIVTSRNRAIRRLRDRLVDKSRGTSSSQVLTPVPYMLSRFGAGAQSVARGVVPLKFLYRFSPIKSVEQMRISMLATNFGNSLVDPVGDPWNLALKITLCSPLDSNPIGVESRDDESIVKLKVEAVAAAVNIENRSLDIPIAFCPAVRVAVLPPNEASN